MATCTTVIDTRTAPEQVWARLADFASLAEWDPGVRSAEQLTIGKVQVGTRYRIVLRLPVGGIPVRYEVHQLSEGHLVVRAGNRFFMLADTIDLRPSGRGTSVAYRAELAGRGAASLAEPLLALLLLRAVRRAERTLVDWLDGLSRPDAEVEAAAA